MSYQYRPDGLPDGLRHSKTPSGGPTTTYPWDLAAGLPVILQDGGNTYLYGLGLLSQTSSPGNQTGYFLPDALGSTAALADATGNVATRYS